MKDETPTLLQLYAKLATTYVNGYIDAQRAWLKGAASLAAVFLPGYPRRPPALLSPAPSIAPLPELAVPAAPEPAVVLSAPAAPQAEASPPASESAAVAEPVPPAQPTVEPEAVARNFALMADIAPDPREPLVEGLLAGEGFGGAAGDMQPPAAPSTAGEADPAILEAVHDLLQPSDDAPGAAPAAERRDPELPAAPPPEPVRGSSPKRERKNGSRRKP